MGILSFRSDAQHRIRNLEIPGLVLTHHPGMTEKIQAAVTSSLTTENLARFMRPKLVDSATSAASRPVAIRMRPIRGTTWRASKVYHLPDRYATNHPEKSIGNGSGGMPMSPR